MVVSNVVSYLLNPSKPLVNNCPAFDPEYDHEYVGTGNRGYLFRASPQQVNFLVDPGVERMQVEAICGSGGIDMQLIPPAGSPPSDYVTGTNNVWCTVATPQAGNWSALISLKAGAAEPAPYSLLTFYGNQIGLNLTISNDESLIYAGQGVGVVVDVDHDGTLAIPPAVSEDILGPNGATNAVSVGVVSATQTNRIRFSGEFRPAVSGAYIATAKADGQGTNHFDRMAFARFYVNPLVTFVSISKTVQDLVQLQVKGGAYDKGSLEISSELSPWISNTNIAITLDSNGLARTTVVTPQGAQKNFFRIRHTGE